jgi:hypothetical protein
MKDDKPQKPAKNPEKWYAPYKPSSAEKALHPDDEWSMRSVPDENGHSNQCTYYVEDGLAKLFFVYPSAGTVDFYKSGTLDHYDHDVAPIYFAEAIDTGKASMTFWKDIVFSKWIGRSISRSVGPNMRKYYQVRPLHAELAGK